MGRCYLGLDEQKGLVDLELLIARKDGEFPGAGSCVSKKDKVQATWLFNSTCPGTSGAQYRVRSLKLFRLQPRAKHV